MTDFDNKLQKLLNAPRPKKGSDSEQVFQGLVSNLVRECGEDNFKWKRFLLSLLYKRFHMLAPEAKACMNRSESGANAGSTSSTGDGERKLFYLAVQQLLNECDQMNDSDAPIKNYAAILKAANVLTELAPFVGGTRDVCYIMEHAITSIVSSTADGADLPLNQPMSLLVRNAVLKVNRVVKESPEKFASLASLLDFAASQLDQDIHLVRAATTSKTDAPDDNTSVVVFPSTLHVFIPHNKRGALSKAQKAKSGRDISIRQVVNSTAEVLLWSRTSVAMQNAAFATCLDRLLTDVSSDQSTAKTALHHMQTVIRKIRHEINSYARDQGFMLTDQFVHDPSKLRMSQVFKGKSGDLTKLEKLAKKDGTIRVLDMINHRFASSPSKIVQYNSVTQFQQSWSVNADPMDEIAQLEQKIQRTRLEKTLQALRDGIIRKTNDGDPPRQKVIASLDISPLNHLAAAFAAAAMGDWNIQEEGDPASSDANEDLSCTKLFIGSSEQSLRSFEDFTTLLDGIVSKSLKVEIDAVTFMGDDGVATTKAFLNFLDRHLVENSDLTLLTSANIAIPKDKHESLVANGCRVHCHNADDLDERLHREGAKAGDITISLAWNTFDDLDLHVLLPSGEELSFMNKNASRGGTACLDVDMNVGGGGSEEPVENVFLGDLDSRIEAPLGMYKVVVQNYAYHTRDRNASIPWKIVVAMNGSKQIYTGECKGTGTCSDVVACEFEYNGRIVPFPVDEDKEKSAFEASDLVNLTSSTGQTLESMVQLVKVHQQLDHLDEVRALVEDMDVTTTEQSRPIEAAVGTLEVTSKDRLDMLLIALPQKFHRVVAEAFGGISLVEECAKEVAHRMFECKLPLSALKRAGYPNDVIDAVKYCLHSTEAVTAQK